MVRKWTVGATGFALLATTLVVVACSSKSDDDDNGSGGSSAKGGTSTTGGKGGSTGGGTMGGTGGTGNGGTGGSTTGGMGGTTTTGGMGGTTGGGMAGAAAGSAGAAMTFDCATPAMATCNLITNWNTFAEASQFQGTYKYQEDTVVKDSMADPTKLHITGTVSTYDGFGIYTGKCSSLAGYTGVTFTLSGTTMSVDAPNALKFVAQMNADEPVDATNMKGACVGAAGVDCISPSKAVMPSDTPQTVNFADMTGGKPTAAVDVTQILGFQFQINPDASATPFMIDLTLSNFQLIGGPGGPVDCSMGSGGMGGMGGMSGAGGAAAGAGGAAAGAGGAAAGAGGAAAGSSGMGGMGGMGGMSGGAGRGGRGGMGGMAGNN